MAVPFPPSLKRTLDSDVSHHHRLQDGDIKGNVRSKNMPGKVNGLQKKPKRVGPGQPSATCEQKPIFFFFRAFYFPIECLLHLIMTIECRMYVVSTLRISELGICL